MRQRGDETLLSDFAESKSQEAFRELRGGTGGSFMGPVCAIFAELHALRPKDAHTLLVRDRDKADKTPTANWRFGYVGTPTLFVIGRDRRPASWLIQGG